MIYDLRSRTRKQPKIKGIKRRVGENLRDVRKTGLQRNKKR
jgi:hypothetical protein